MKMRSDQGKNVDGKTINELCQYLNIVKERSSPYHPEGNGLAERAIGSVKSLISVICESRNMSETDWDLIIYEAVLAHNSTVNKSLKYTPFMCQFSNNSRLPVDSLMGIKTNHDEKLNGKLIMDNANSNIAEAKLQHKSQHNKTCLVNQFEIGQEVMLKRNF